MAAQTNYRYETPKGVPGGKVDIAFDEVITRMNEAEDGVLKFGMAAAVGSDPGSNITLPKTGTTAGQIEGVVLAHPNTEQDRKGEVIVRKDCAVGIMRKGHVWGRLSADAVPTYGEKAYVVVDGEDAGAFTSESEAASVYFPCALDISGAKEIVADDTASLTASQIKLSEVTPVSNGYEPAIGDYVVLKQNHGATLDIGATFGNASDDGIAIICLK